MIELRPFGSYLAHKIYDEIVDWTKTAPGLSDEVKEIRSKVLPKDGSNFLFNGGKSSTEEYESLVAKGHEVIDRFFRTNQAKSFTQKEKEKDFLNQVSTGTMPVPGGVSKIFSNTNRLIKAGNAMDRGGFTRVGRGLMKHGYREGSGYSKPIGNPAQINAQGQRMLESILTHQKREYILYDSSRMGKTVDIYAPNIGGVRYSLEGEFIGFLEFKK